MLLVFILCFNSVIYADNGIPALKISIPRTSMNIGEPLVVGLEYRFKEPQISNKKEILKQIDPEAYLCIDKENVSIYRDRLQYLFKLQLQDEAGLDYKGTFIIWYNVLEKKLFFDKPGEYTVRAGLSKDFLSNPVKITVKSENKKALEALGAFQNLDDYLFLFVGLNESPEKRVGLLERLEQVQKQSEGTMLEKWSAARLGIEGFRDLQYSAIRDQNIVDQIQMYLNIGIELPDEFPVREEALYDLGGVEAFKGNKDRAASLRDELVKKYPKGKFAKKYLESREILANIGKTTERDNQTTSASSNKTIQIFIICGLSVVAIGIVIFIGKSKVKNT